MRATDAAANTSPVVEYAFTLDTVAPSISIDSPAANAAVTAGELLSGVASGTGSNLTQLAYAVNGGTSFPIPFSATGEYSVPIDLSQLVAGQHTLVVQARDAAGNLSTASRTFQLAAPIPLTLVNHAPLDGAVDLGTTFKPKISFSRPINAATLTATNFFATSPDGQKLPAKIVVSDDGTFAWLFVHRPNAGRLENYCACGWLHDSRGG